MLTIFKRWLNLIKTDETSRQDLEDANLDEAVSPLVDNTIIGATGVWKINDIYVSNETIKDIENWSLDSLDECITPENNFKRTEIWELGKKEPYFILEEK